MCLALIGRKSTSFALNQRSKTIMENQSFNKTIDSSPFFCNLPCLVLTSSLICQPLIPECMMTRWLTLEYMSLYSEPFQVFHSIVWQCLRLCVYSTIPECSFEQLSIQSQHLILILITRRYSTIHGLTSLAVFFVGLWPRP